MAIKEVIRYSNCFVCGDKNAHGLQAEFFFDGIEAFCEIEATNSFEGYRGIYHGGILSTLLDEVMIKAILAEGIYAVTAELTVRYHLPVLVGDKLRLSGTVSRRKGKVYWTEGTVIRNSGEILASATGKYIEAGNGLRDQLIKSTD